MNTDFPVKNSSSQKISILVGVCSSLKHPERRSVLRETWLQHPQPGIECRFFIGGQEHPQKENDVIILDCPDDYEHLPLKILAFFRYALENYDFEWLFKCDDDTYVALDRLLDLPDEKYSLIGDISLRDRLAPSGGAGYMLPRSMVEKIVASSDVPETGAEDLIYGKIALDLGAIPFATERLCLHNGRYPLPDNDTITSHWCSPEQIKAIDTFYHKHPDVTGQAKHIYWNDDLFFHKNGFFRRKSSGCYGTWSINENDALCLKWFAWGEEQLMPVGNHYIGSAMSLIPPTPRQIPNALVELLLKKEENRGITEKQVYLHLGCGNNSLENWFNMDLPNFDITKPLPFPDNSVDALYLEHVIEHILPSDAYDFFLEAKRILKHQGVLRLAFPDLLRIAKKTTPEYVNFLHNCGWGDGTAGSEIRSIVVNHHHKAIWTAETMMVVLESAGFKTAEKNLGESEYPHLMGLEHHGDQIGKVINQIETSCVEAVKP